MTASDPAADALYTHAPNAVLALADGTVFHGYGIGTEGEAIGELCFNTAMTGYQEVMTDPSYAGQIITFTFPHIGNVGTNDEDVESEAIHASGLIVREAITAPSNYRATSDFNEWLKGHEVTGICGIDTRLLTNHLRTHGPQNAVIHYDADSIQKMDIGSLCTLANEYPTLKGMELAKPASTEEPYIWNMGLWEWNKGYVNPAEQTHHVVALGFGEKQNILRHLTARGCKVTVMPADSRATDILKRKPDGIFLSNGPGDPAATGEYAIPEITALIASGTPIFGICLGHQLLALAAGATTEKMEQGHRGANHPVKHLTSGKVEITAQNHGFVVSQDNLPDGVEVTHLSLFDNTVQGIRLKGKPVFSVQYHPESSPGPHDSRYLFDEFVKNMDANNS